jgi:hypothetical protein
MRERPMGNRNEIWSYLIATSKDIEELAVKIRKNISKVNDPKSEALFETSAEVLMGLKHAYDDYLKQDELAWK